MKIEDSNLETILDILKTTTLQSVDKWVSVGAAAAVHCRIVALN